MRSAAPPTAGIDNSDLPKVPWCAKNHSSTVASLDLARLVAYVTVAPVERGAGWGRECVRCMLLRLKQWRELGRCGCCSSSRALLAAAADDAGYTALDVALL